MLLRSVSFLEGGTWFGDRLWAENFPKVAWENTWCSSQPTRCVSVVTRGDSKGRLGKHVVLVATNQMCFRGDSRIVFCL
jgi:hypothetical protein